MILRLTGSLRLSIDGAVNKKRCASGTIFPMAYMCILMTVIFVLHMFRLNVLEYNYDYINNSLTQALLGGCVVNWQEYAQNGIMVIQDAGEPVPGDCYVLNSYELFKDCLKYNLELDDNWNISSGHGIEGNVAVEEYRVYNVVETDGGQQITEYVIAGNSVYYIMHAAGEMVSVETTDGIIEISETSVYARISFTLHLMGYSSMMDEGINEAMMDGRFMLDRVVGVKER